MVYFYNIPNWTEVKKTYRAQAACEMQGEVILEVGWLEQVGLDDVIEAELPDRDEDSSGWGPIGSVEQLADTLLSGNPDKPVDGMFVAGK